MSHAAGSEPTPLAGTWRAQPASTPTRAEAAAVIDHTLLRPEATADQVAELVAQAARLGTYCVCVSPSQLPVAVPGGLRVATVCGFPSGAHTTAVKAAEAREAVDRGAHEVDMVLDLAQVKEHDYNAVESEVRAVKEAVGDSLLKVIIESAALSDEEVVAVCRASERAGADYVKTSTGFHPAGGASTHAVALMRATVGERLGVKASGGIRTAQDAVAMLRAGASRLGVSATVSVLEGLED
ncbi:deoxyribose-phosphate aldolase [Actinomyces sp. 2119]|uniref:Deoxyribose-phosphate aldolase n=1 Tax=Actinomyces lilanjuaniae TaxID=2321394 RepID=A0ABN5PRT1_9ACTO|nr:MULTISPECIES: deoxyribose-phosphate aldolase [Actinomyces]AYD89450.1 deoxyribose-phosphate aldolase [Actinomyces lilanjuaniae]RJF43195.1 deoxyribose-phosphate aldolase [Actinomyces sp. 2119]